MSHRELGGAGRAAWSRLLRELGADATREGAAALVDWPGAPLRPARTLTRRRAHARLDGPDGRAQQEEYVEWRVVRDSRDRLRRVELTTELVEYWRVLAAHAPQRLLATVARFAREPGVDRATVYADLDPLAPGVTPAQREAAFAAALATSPYHTGERAICCMTHPSNTLAALLRLVRAAAVPREVVDPRTRRARPPTAAEAIPLFPDAAELHRASDPLLVERLARAAWEGRRVQLEDPVGVCIAGVEHTRLRRPDGRAVPPEWFRLERGGRRLTFELPAGGAVDAATGDRLRHGAQVAELVQLAVRLRVSEPGRAGPRERIGPSAA